MNRVPPSGTVAFLFTDVEGSTRLWEVHPPETARAIAIHDSVLRDAISTHDGLVFSTGGDAFCAAFSSVNAAVEAGVAAQLGLLGLFVVAEPLRVRMAVHVGEAEERGGDYFGPVLNRCARLMAAGHGGQLLLSGTAAELARQHLPDWVALVDLGEHRLKDLSAPERVFEVRYPELAATFPPLRTLDRVLNNLPSQVTSFFGREREVADVGKLLSDHRLVTITGVGGVGKTRLALQVAAEMLDLFPEGVWFVNLAPVTDPGLVADTIVDTLGFRPRPGEPLIDSLTAHLRNRTALLLVDNCEHLIDSVATVITRLATATSRAKVLATSRERLGITGERAFPIPTLPLPEPTSDPALIEGNPAVQMFLNRATALNPNFNSGTDTLAAIAHVCRRLDCIPLAIELAAARTLSLTPAQIADRLNERFRLLTGGQRGGMPHHQTLQATVDWSYQLLQQSDRRLLERLSVFRSDFELIAAERVCSDADLDPFDVADGLARLVDRSLVTASPFIQEMRYSLLETIRQFAARLLTESGQSKGVERQFAEHYLEVAERLQVQLDSDESGALERFRVEHENLLASLLWALDETEIEIGMRLFSALRWYWWSRGVPSEGSAWAAKLLSLDKPVPPILRAKALSTAGAVSLVGDVQAARTHLEEAVNILRPLTDSEPEAAHTLSRVLITLSAAVWGGGNLADAMTLNEEVLDLARTASDAETEAIALTNLALCILQGGGDQDQATSRAERAVAIFRRVNRPSRLADALSVLGEVMMARQQYVEAQSCFEESAAIARGQGYLPAQIEATDNLALTLLALGEPSDAAQALIGIMPLIVGHAASDTVHPLVTMAVATKQLGHHELAVRLLGAARNLCDSTGFQPYDELKDRMQLCETELRTLLSNHDFQNAWQEGTTKRLDQITHHALTILGSPAVPTSPI